MTTPPPFADRLATARELVTAIPDILGGLPRPPTHLADQAGAASKDAHSHLHRWATALRALEPDRPWTEVDGEGPYGAEIHARLLAAISGSPLCPHIRRNPVQPCWGVLALHLIVCQRCLRTYRHPPADEADRCDWCGIHGIELFTPLALQHGPLIVFGDACPDCADVLTIAV